MKIPKTTVEKPYIEFRFDKKGVIHLKETSSWWGGINSSFISSDGEGNSCPPKELKSYIIAFLEKKEKNIEKEIKILKTKLSKIKSEKKNFNLK